MHHCTKCNEPAVVLQGVTQTTCECNAPIAANISAVARGVGGVRV